MARKATRASAAKKVETELKDNDLADSKASDKQLETSEEKYPPPSPLDKSAENGKASADGGDGSVIAQKAASSNEGGGEFILVEDVDSSEPQAPAPVEKKQVEKASEADEEEHYGEESMEHGHDDHVQDGHEDGEYVEDETEAVGHQDLHDVVNEVLDSKLESFQVQIQKMFTMMQGSMEAGPSSSGASTSDKVSSAVGVGAGGDERKESLGGKSDDGGDSSQKEGKVTDQKEKVPELLIHEQKEWMEFLGQIKDILGLPSTTVESVLDETVGSRASSAEFLPAEGIVKNSWQNIKGKTVESMSRPWTKQKMKGYRWPAEDIDLYGSIPPPVNPDLIGYLEYTKWGKLVAGLSQQSWRYMSDLRILGNLFRFQQRIVSYASYFTAAISKQMAAEDVPPSDTVQEILKNLAQCLKDVCDSSVHGCVLTTKTTRRLYIDALGIPPGKDPQQNILNAPISDELFPPSLLTKMTKDTGINLKNPHLSKKAPGFFRGRGTFRGPFRGRGMSRGSRGNITRGGSSARGGINASSGPMRGNPAQGGGTPPPRGRGVSARGRGYPTRSRGNTPRGRGGWQPGNRGSNRGGGRGTPRGRGLKRHQQGESPVTEKHRRIQPVEDSEGGYNDYNESGHRSRSRERGSSPRDQGRRSFSPSGREKGVDYQSVPDDPSSYYRSPSEREYSPDRYGNEGWY